MSFEGYHPENMRNIQPRPVTCPNCLLPTTEFSLRQCASCRRIICNRCSVRHPSGASLCFRCAGTERNRFERFVDSSNRATRAVFRFLFGPAWFPN